MTTPRTRYAKSGVVNIAYQVIGDAPLDLSVVSGWVSDLEADLEIPAYAEFYARLASSSRLIRFDKRGTGLSDRVPTDRLPTLDERIDDVRAVMDAAQSKRAAIVGYSEVELPVLGGRELLELLPVGGELVEFLRS